MLSKAELKHLFLWFAFCLTAVASTCTGPEGEEDNQNSPPESPVSGGGVEILYDSDYPRVCLGDPVLCTEEYLEFLQHPDIVELSQPVDCNKLTEQMESWARGDGPPWEFADSPPDDPAAAVAESTGLAPLLGNAQIISRGLRIIVLNEEWRESPTGYSYREQTLLIEDELVGQIPARLLLPAEEHPAPAIVFLPGHHESAEDTRDSYFGQFLPESGYAALLLSFRAYTDAPDHELSLAFQCSGLVLVGLRVYEALLALTFIQTLPQVDPSRVAVMGHSGGSLVGNILLWLEENPAAAHVTDLFDDYVNLWVPDGMPNWQLDCATSEALHELSPTINNFKAAPRPVLQVPYGFTPSPVEPNPNDPAALQETLSFLDEVL